MSYKIIVFSLIGIGHVNPMIKIVNELIKTYNAKVIVYSTRDFKAYIEGIGAEHRVLDDLNNGEILNDIKSEESMFQTIKTLFKYTYTCIDNNTLKIAKIIEEEKPDVVLYDNYTLDAKFAVDLLKKKHKNGLIKQPPPTIAYWTTFATEEGVYPNAHERKMTLKMPKLDVIRLLGLSIWYTVKFRKLFRRINLPFPGIRKMLEKDSSILNLVLVVPELQPRAHLFDSNTKFVGAAISDDVHVTGVEKYENPELNVVLKTFPVINPSYEYKLDKRKATKRLIYVSLGTIHNNNVNIYSIIIDAFKEIDGSNDFLVVISLGKDLYRKFKEKISNKTMNIPDNIILTASAPQLEILKRASLFVSHGGMNSTSESVHYGVPMIVLPMHGDQFGNAYRIGGELGLGIQLNTKNLTQNILKESVYRIFDDTSYRKRCNRFASYSHEHFGHKNASEIIISLINKNK